MKPTFNAGTRDEVQAFVRLRVRRGQNDTLRAFISILSGWEIFIGRVSKMTTEVLKTLKIAKKYKNYLHKRKKMCIFAGDFLWQSDVELLNC